MGHISSGTTRIFLSKVNQQTTKIVADINLASSPSKYLQITMPKASKKQQNATFKKFAIDCKIPFQDSVLDPAAFIKFLEDSIKVDGRTGNLGPAKNSDTARVSVTRESEESARIIVTAQLPFSKRYLKYLTKKYLKKEQLRDYLHVIASNATTYELKYFNITDGAEVGGNDDDE